MDDELLTVSDVAKRMKVSPETVRRWLRAGRMHGTLLGDRAGWRIPASEIQRFLAAIGETRGTESSTVSVPVTR